MIIQQPLQHKETGRWQMVERSDEDKSVFRELCPCTLGHSHESEAKICANHNEILKNPVKLHQVLKEVNCYGCKFYGYGMQRTKLTIHGKGEWHGKTFIEFCQRPELQTEENNYNGEYAKREYAESCCADEDYKYFEKESENL